MRPSLLVLPLTALLLVACSAPADDTPEDGAQEADQTSATAPPNFLTVRPGLYRGGHPDAKGLDYLKQLGVKRILNLEVADLIEAFPWDISREESGARERGLAELRFPMSAFESGTSDRFDQKMDEILAILKTASPDDSIYVHCKHGQDRTGLVLGLERVSIEHWQPKAAHDEMVRIGFHTGFAGLENYFQRKTNWHP